jgi:hypothetical protein
MELPPLAVTSIDLGCKEDTDKWTLDVVVDSWAGGGTTQWTEDFVYVETHSVPVESYAEDGSTSTLALSLGIVTDWRFQAANVSTIFTCGDDPTVMFGLFDREGEPVYCALFDHPGSDPGECPEGVL